MAVKGERIVVRYSEAFKRKVVEDIECGRFRSAEEARQRYGIKGTMTVSGWVRSYGRNHLLAKVVRVVTPEERDELKKAKDRIRELEKLVCDGQIKLGLSEAYLRIACRDAGTTPEEIKKKELPKP